MTPPLDPEALSSEIERLRAGRETVLRHARAVQAGTDQLLADFRRISHQLLAVDVCAVCKPAVTKAVRDLGPLIDQAEAVGPWTEVQP